MDSENKKDDRRRPDRDFVFFCGVCGGRLELKEGRYGLYRRCEKYMFQNREVGEKPCMNRLSLQDTKMMRRYLENKAETAGIAEGDTGTVDHILYRVGETDQYFITVYIVNTKKIKNFIGWEGPDDAA